MTISIKDGAGVTQTIATTDDLLSVVATAAKQDALFAKDFATQTTLAAVLAKIIAAPATAANQDLGTAAINLVGTRAYNYAGIQRVAVAATAANSTAITGTEVMVYASTKCYIRVGGTATATTAIPLEAGEKFHFRITTGAIISVIRDAADGFLHIVPVA